MMNPVQTEEQLHELQCKIKCLCCTGRFALLSLLKWMLKHIDMAQHRHLSEPYEILPEVLKQYQVHFSLEKEITSLGYNNNKQLITTSKDWKDIRSRIFCEFFDITLLCDFLLNLPVLPSNTKQYLPIQCSDIEHLGTIPCTCSKVCCGICLKCIVCLHCCEYKKIKKYVLEIKTLRDRYSHLTLDKCQEIDTNPTDQAAIDWHRKNGEGADAIKSLLKFLKEKGEIDQRTYEDKKLDIKLVLFRTKEIYWNNFAGSLDLVVPYLRYSSHIFIPFSLLKFDQNQKSALLSRFQIYDSEEFVSFRENFLEKVTSLLVQRLQTGFITSPFQIELYEMDVNIEDSAFIKATLHLESKEYIIPDCYKKMDSVESRNLRFELNKLCEEELNKILRDSSVRVTLNCRGCRFASIHLYYKIYATKTTLTDKVTCLIKNGLRKVISMPSIQNMLDSHDLQFCETGLSFKEHAEEFVVGFTLTTDDKAITNLIEENRMAIEEAVRKEIQKELAKKEEEKVLSDMPSKVTEDDSIVTMTLSLDAYKIKGPTTMINSGGTSQFIDKNEYQLRLLTLIHEGCDHLRTILHDPARGNMPSDQKQLYQALLPFKRRLAKFSWNQAIIFPINKQTNSALFNITILCQILINCCPRVQAPIGGWRIGTPLPTDLSDGADIIRIRNARNLVVHERVITASRYDQLWNTIEAPLKRLGYDVAKLSDLRTVAGI